MAFKKYEIEGNIYYFNPKNGGWYNSSYTTVSREELYKLNHIRTNAMDFTSMSTNELIDIAQSMKDNNDLVYSVKIFDELLKRQDDVGTVRKILPRYTSILRKLLRPKDAISMFEKYSEMYGKSVTSPALFTSIAAAYCDIGDYVEARKKANVAHAMSGGNSSPELISVYARIKSMEK